MEEQDEGERRGRRNAFSAQGQQHLHKGAQRSCAAGLGGLQKFLAGGHQGGELQPG